MRQIDVSIDPTLPQYEFLTTQSKFPAIVAGFGAGKTEAVVQRSILGKLANPKTNRGFYEPTYDLVRQIAFPRFEAMLEKWQIPYRLLKSPNNRIDIKGYGSIIFRSMDRPEKIIGYEHADADIDELDTLKKDEAAEVWRRVQSRNRQKKASGKNTIGVATTPEGFRFVYDRWHKQKHADYEIIRAATYSNPHLPEDYIDNLRETYTEELLNAYIEGLFVNLTSGTVFTGFNRVSCDTSDDQDGKEPLYIGMDFNVTNMSAVVYVKREHGYSAVRELTGIYDTPAMITAIEQLFPDRHITIFPDASGKARKTVGASVSDISLLKAASFKVKAKDSNPLIKDRVNAANVALSKGKIKVNVSKCPEYADCLEQLAYDKNGVPDKSSGLDHLTDAGTYPIAYLMPLKKPITKMNASFPI